MTDEELPRAPRGLRARGKKLWADVCADHELRPDELAVLAAAARTADELVRLEQELTTAEVLVLGSTGQVRAHPLFAEARAHRKVLGMLLKQLGLVEGGEDGGKVVPLHISAARRAAVNVRWDRVRAEQGEA